MVGLYGVLTAMSAMASAAIALFFWRFWRQVGDRLFLLFAIAFLLFAGNWFWLAAIPPQQESRHLVYLLRLLGFVIILVAIVDKNRSDRE
jgi:hypothetical protein